jgi:hypothetical protein
VVVTAVGTYSTAISTRGVLADDVPRPRADTNIALAALDRLAGQRNGHGNGHVLAAVSSVPATDQDGIVGDGEQNGLGGLGLPVVRFAVLQVAGKVVVCAVRAYCRPVASGGRLGNSVTGRSVDRDLAALCEYPRVGVGARDRLGDILASI